MVCVCGGMGEVCGDMWCVCIVVCVYVFSV